MGDGDPGAGNRAPACVLVLRILAPLAPADEAALVAFADRHGVQFFLQPGGPDTAVPFHAAEPRLAYTLPEFDLVFPYAPTEFTQVNPAINRVLVRRALALLDPRAGERVADFFCGLGNFTLPIARRGATVIGIEGSAALVRRRRGRSRRLNGLAARATFRVANLFAATPESLEALGPLDKVLLDPPREGAIALVKALPGDGAPRRIVYVSCARPRSRATRRCWSTIMATRSAAAGVINMFPHTAHVESIALFER